MPGTEEKLPSPGPARLEIRASFLALLALDYLHDSRPPSRSLIASLPGLASEELLLQQAMEELVWDLGRRDLAQNG